MNRKVRATRVGQVPYYGATGQAGWIDEPLFDEELCLLGEDGAPFLDRSRPKAFVISGPSWVNNHAHVLRARTGTSNRFLKYALDEADYGSYVSGTTRLKLTKGAMQRIPIRLPPLPEQHRIVAAIEEQFSRLDAADGALALAVRRSDALMASSLESATTGAGNLIPLGEAATDFRYGTSVKTLVDGDGPPVLRIPNVRGGRIEPTPLKYATVSAEQLGDCFVSDGDLLFVRTNGSRDLIGRAAVTNIGRMAFASYLIRARPREGVLDPRWAVLVLASPRLRAEIESRAATTAGQYNLNLAGIRSLPIPLPPLDEQRRIVAEVEAQLSRIDAMRAAIERAQRRSAALRRAILERAFQGELVQP